MSSWTASEGSPPSLSVPVVVEADAREGSKSSGRERRSWRAAEDASVAVKGRNGLQSSVAHIMGLKGDG